MNQKMVAGAGGEIYVPYENRSGAESAVYFTRDLSADGLRKVYAKIGEKLTGKLAVKVHTGEKNGPNIIPRDWVRALFEDLHDATIVETNTYYDGDRYTTKQHRETIAVNGWNFAPVDIMDEEGTIMLPVSNGKWFTQMSVGSHLTKYDSFLALTHFKGHTMGGFGGSNKNIGIGNADGRIGKAMIHTSKGSNDMWDINMEELMERMTESTKATYDYFGDRIAYMNVMRNMSVSCDCEGLAAEPVVTPNIGILGSVDILALDTASVDLIYAMKEEDKKAMKERIETRHGHRQLSYMHELKMGNNRYHLIDLDQQETEISTAQAVAHVLPFAG